jgi:hypothetical protein
MPTELRRKTPVVQTGGVINQALAIAQGMLMVFAIVLAAAIFLKSLPQPSTHLPIKPIAVDLSHINSLP